MVDGVVTPLETRTMDEGVGAGVQGAMDAAVEEIYAPFTTHPPQWPRVPLGEDHRQHLLHQLRQHEPSHHS